MWWGLRSSSKRSRSAQTTTWRHGARTSWPPCAVSIRVKGVVVLTDMFGGTPSNLALSCMNGGSVEVVAGINLPMLIKLASVRDEEPLSDAVSHAQEAGRKYINIASRVLSGK